MLLLSVQFETVLQAWNLDQQLAYISRRLQLPRYVEPLSSSAIAVNLGSDIFFLGKIINRLWSLFLWLLFCFKKKRFVSLHWILIESANGELCQLFEAMFTLYRIAFRADTKNFPIWTSFWRVTLHFRDRCRTPSLRYRNRSMRASSPIWASPFARAFSRDSFHSPKQKSLLAGYRNRAEITVLTRQQKPYPALFSCRRNSNPV